MIGKYTNKQNLEYRKTPLFHIIFSKILKIANEKTQERNTEEAIYVGCRRSSAEGAGKPH